MTRMYLSPPVYLQGDGLLKESAQHLQSLGTKGLLMADEVVSKIAGDDYFDYLNESFTMTKVLFSGSPSVNEIDRITAIGKEQEVDFIIGMGGGKTLDPAKAIADNLGVKIVIIPTTASMDAPTSRMSVIYFDDGTFDQYRFYNKNPDIIMVDTSIVVQAPPRLLASGISDALATWIEARGVREGNGKTMFGTYPTLTALAIAEKAEEVIFKYGKLAMEANRTGVVTPAFEDVVEANILLSGIGFESGGVGAAHPIQNALSVVYDKLKPVTHGERVAFTAMTQLFMENKSEEVINRYLDFYLDLDLPVALDDLFKVKMSYEDLLEVGVVASADYEPIHQLPLDITPDSIVKAMLALDGYATAYKKARNS